MRQIIKKAIREVLNEGLNNKEFIAYHSSYSKIDDFDFDKIEIKPNSSTRIDALFFSDTPQKSWGDYLYKVKIISNNLKFDKLFKFNNRNIYCHYDVQFAREFENVNIELILNEPNAFVYKPEPEITACCRGHNQIPVPCEKTA